MVHTTNHDPKATPATGGEDDRLTRLCAALERAASWVRRVAPPGEFNTVTMSALDAVVVDGPLRLSDLAARERISQPGMTGLVTRLADAGLVERRADPHDRRVALVAATDAGRAHLRARRAYRADRLAEHIERLPDDQRRALLDATEALCALTMSTSRRTTIENSETAGNQA